MSRPTAKAPIAESQGSRPVQASRILGGDTPPSLKTFADHVDELAELVRGRTNGWRADDISAALDGGVSRHLRKTVPLVQRREQGAFFTSRRLSDLLLARDSLQIQEARILADPACGAGDLLLGLARRLPLQRNVSSTLRDWGTRLVARDLSAQYVRAALLRLALLGATRHRSSWRGEEDSLGELFPDIRVGDGRELEYHEQKVLVALNPPFGTVTANTSWGSGRLARAGVFADECVSRLEAGADLRFILPDVLRTGSNYRRWRDHMEGRLAIETIRSVGQFDTWTDVDVFLL